MAVASGSENFSIERMTHHLQKGPFAPIFDQSKERDDPIALKLMCIVDYKAQESNLYTRIQESNDLELLRQMMAFRSYGSFKYYDYQVGQRMGKRLLKCKFCALTGPYGIILSHMVFNHNGHIGLKMCNYCDSIELRKHYDEDTIIECYANYSQHNGIKVNENICDIVADFYATLKQLSYKLKIATIRKHTYRADWFVDATGTVYTERPLRNKTKNISDHLAELDREFNRVMSNLYGRNNALRLTQQQPAIAEDREIICISYDHDDDNATGTAFKAENANVEGTSTVSAASDAGENISMPVNPEPAAADFQNECIVSTITTRTALIQQPANSSYSVPIPQANASSDPFLQLIAQRLDEAPDAPKRRKIQNAILQAMFSAENE